MQNRTCLDHRDRLAAKSRRVIDNRRHFVVWVYFAEFGAKVVAFEDVINYRAIRNRGLLQHEGSFAQDFHADLTQRRKHLSHVPSQRSEEHTSELQSLMRISYAVLCVKK